MDFAAREPFDVTWATLAHVFGLAWSRLAPVGDPIGTPTTCYRDQTRACALRVDGNSDKEAIRSRHPLF